MLQWIVFWPYPSLSYLISLKLFLHILQAFFNLPPCLGGSKRGRKGVRVRANCVQSNRHSCYILCSWSRPKLAKLQIKVRKPGNKIWYQPAFCIIWLSPDKNKWITTRQHCCAFVNILLPCINKVINRIQELKLKEAKCFQLGDSWYIFIFIGSDTY